MLSPHLDCVDSCERDDRRKECDSNGEPEGVPDARGRTGGTGEVTGGLQQLSRFCKIETVRHEGCVEALRDRETCLVVADDRSRYARVTISR